MPSSKIISVHVPEALAAAVDALIERRRREQPWSVPTISLIVRELLARGLEAAAAEHANTTRGKPR